MAQITQQFGPGVIGPDGSLDRAAMRDRVFDNRDARLQLESILHPMIGEVTQSQAQAAKGWYVVFVVPLLVESGRWRDKVNRICVVDCDPATQVARVRARSGLTDEAIARIMSVQATREARLAIADDVVLNDGDTTLAQLERQARLLHDSWCEQAARADSAGRSNRL